MTKQKPKAGRPDFPQDYGVNPADTGGMIAWDWVSKQMAEARNYWICSTRPDGRPHAAPVWGVWLDEVFYFGTGRLARKARNLSANPEVVVHLESGDETVIFEGRVDETTDATLFKRIAQAYGAKYPGYDPGPEPDAGSVFFALRPSTAFAWREKDFPTSATRWSF